MARFRIAERERSMEIKMGICADPTENGAKTGVFSMVDCNICRNTAFLRIYGLRSRSILRQRTASGRPIMRLNDDECGLFAESSG